MPYVKAGLEIIDPVLDLSESAHNVASTGWDAMERELATIAELHERGKLDRLDVAERTDKLKSETTKKIIATAGDLDAHLRWIARYAPGIDPGTGTTPLGEFDARRIATYGHAYFVDIDHDDADAKNMANIGTIANAAKRNDLLQRLKRLDTPTRADYLMRAVDRSAEHPLRSDLLATLDVYEELRDPALSPSLIAAWSTVNASKPFTAARDKARRAKENFDAAREYLYSAKAARATNRVAYMRHRASTRKAA